MQIHGIHWKVWNLISAIPKHLNRWSLKLAWVMMPGPPTTVLNFITIRSGVAVPPACGNASKCMTAVHISMRCLNPLLRYYYVRFQKTNGRHIGILLLVSILTSLSLSASHFASAYQISSRSAQIERNYDVISILKDGGHGVENLANLLVDSGLVSALV